MNKTRIARRAGFLFSAALLTLTASCALAAGSAPPRSPGEAALEKLNKTLNASAGTAFNALVSSPAKAGEEQVVYRVTGELQSPNLMTATVDQVSGAKNDKLPAVFTCDGKTYTVYAKGSKQYLGAPAADEGFESNSTDIGYFVYKVLGEPGAAMYDVCDLFYPADFNLADDKLPDGMTRKIETSLSRIKHGSHWDTLVTQRVTGAHGSKRFLTEIDRDTNTLVSWSYDSLKKGVWTNVMTCAFSRMDLSKIPVPKTRFAANVDAAASEFQVPAGPGTPAPQFTVKSADGSDVKLADYAGKVVVIDFWATWCGPCRATLPSTDKLAALYQPKGVVFMPVCSWDTKDNFDSWAPAHKSWSMTWLFDPAADDGDNSIATKLYAVSGIPTQYVIGKDGVIVYRGYADTGDGQKPLISAIDKALSAG